VASLGDAVMLRWKWDRFSTRGRNMTLARDGAAAQGAQPQFLLADDCERERLTRAVAAPPHEA
jgi:hypothetical protein